MNFFKNMYKGITKDPEAVSFGTCLRIAKNIEDVMAEKEISKSQLAEKLDCSKPYVTKILRGDANLTVLTLSKISIALGVKLNIDLGKKDQHKSLDAFYQQIKFVRNNCVHDTTFLSKYSKSITSLKQGDTRVVAGRINVGARKRGFSPEVNLVSIGGRG